MPTPITEKYARAVAIQAGYQIPDAASPIGAGGIIAAIIQVILSLLGGGGLGGCLGGTPSGGKIKDTLAYPNRRHQRIAWRTTREVIDDPTAAATVYESLVPVAKTLTEDDASAMFQEANS